MVSMYKTIFKTYPLHQTVADGMQIMMQNFVDQIQNNPSEFS